MPPSARSRWRSASPTVIIFSISRLQSLSFSPSVSTGCSAPRRRAGAKPAVFLLLCVVPFAPQVVRQCGKVVYFTCMHKLDRFASNRLELADAFPTDRDSVWGYDVLAQDYLYADIIPCFRYFAIQRWMEDSDPQIAPEIDEMLATDPPVWVFIYQEDTEMAEKLLSLGYTAEPRSVFLIFHRAA